MGNYISCTLSGPGGKSNPGKDAVTVIFPGCDVRRFDEPTKAAELMFDMPNFFLVNAKSLQIGERLTALNADQDLEMRNVYVFFPMKRLSSVVKTEDMGQLLLTASKENKRVHFGSVKVSPECDRSNDKDCSSPKLNLDDFEEYSMPEYFRHRMSMCRSKKPMLETIVEEHFSLRFMMMMEN
ncbi:hypothetical protein F511_40659 [Dorcoceras hygrometricum]|uniref:Uncharacterized protein n=1 Tax=Dorcoceras hygrometricum TaxID=472368 RepID=A0A2Z7CP43_9LAMI|nr:hypothetical protein F511_40659 [Dorcoceras hygrometricum]